MTPLAKRLIAWFLFLALIAFVVLYAVGAFGGARIPPGKEAAPASLPAPAATAKAERAEVDVVEEAVGTVRSRTRVAVGAQVPGRIVTIAAQVGERVKAGQVLVTLDDRELAAGLAGARDALDAATAAKRQAEQARAQGDARLTLARSRFDRVKAFRERGAATDEQFEAAQADLAQSTAGLADADAAIRAAEARIAQARQIIAAAEVALGHATVAAPIDGVVAERTSEPGDLAWPGRTLLVVHDPEDLRLDAVVREGLISQIAPGAELPVEIPAVGVSTTGRVAEIVPAADPRTRTFEVRVAIPATARVVPGMYGRLRMRVARRSVVSVPAAAIERVGQLETVVVEEHGGWARRLVSSGARLDGGAVEVLAGLAGGEVVGVPAGGAR